jgi:ankyrin repeat protein
MESSFSPKCGFAFVFITLLITGCSGDPDAEFKTAFHRAVDLFFYDAEESKRRPALEQLRQAVDNGADLNIVYEGATPLYLAIWESDKELAALLIEGGADLSARDLDQDGEVDDPPLLIAIMDPGEQGINPDIIKLLIAAGSDVNGNEDVLPPLGVAAEANSLGTVKALLKAGADPNGHEYWEDYRPLRMAAMNGNVEMFDLLRKSGAEQQDIEGLLTAAAASTNPEMVKRVLPLYSGPKRNPDLFGVAAWGLLYDEGDEAKYARAKTIFEQLRTAGFQPEPSEFDNIMIMAAESLDKPALESMLSYGASANAVDDSGATCLMRAITGASWKAMMETDIDAKGLFKHQDSSVKDVVRLLLDHGADVNAQDSKGRTALMYAATTFNVSAVRQLLEQSADQSLVDTKGKNAEQLMMTEASFGLPTEFKAQAIKRAEQIQVKLESDHSKAEESL